MSHERAGALTRSGVAAAALLGATALVAGWRWAVLLVTYFVAASALSRWRAAARAARTEGIIAKGGARDAWQVFANGGVFGAAAAAFAVSGHPAWWTVGAAALAASTADTWATEIGTLSNRPPRSVTTWRIVPPGTSGAITLAGTAASVAGALFIALLVVALGGGGAALAIALGGVAGSFADTLLGATLQARRWCDTCREGTERPVHRCGQPTRPAGGIPWLDNDAVNFACTLCGAAVAALAWRLG